MRTRFALYYAPPPVSALEEFGASWLGWNARRGLPVERLALPGLDPAFVEDITAEPARYGLHATLKPPFALADGRRVDEFERAVASFCANRPAFPMPRLMLAQIDGFLALVPTFAAPDLVDLASACVTELDCYRAPLDEKALARRRQATLTPRQEAFLTRWGYPYVLEEFRFHITLTRRLSTDETNRVEPLLAAWLEPILADTLVCESVSLFQQDGDAAFIERARFPLRP